jgi:type I restriction enzyme, S subunit
LVGKRTAGNAERGCLIMQPYTKNKQPNSNSDLEVQAGWECRRLKFSVTYNDESLPENTDPDYLIAYVDISSVDLVSGIKAVEEVTFDKAPSRARRIVRDGDTIISTVRTYLKAITPIKNPPENMIVSTGFAVIRPHQTINERFLGYVLQVLILLVQLLPILPE